MIDALTSFISKENEIVSQLKKSGYDFKITQDTALGVTNIFTDTSGHTVGSDAHNKKNPFKTSYNLYTLLSVPQDQPAVVTTEANPNYNPNLPVSAINQPTVAAKKSNGLTTAVLISATIFGLKAIL